MPSQEEIREAIKEFTTDDFNNIGSKKALDILLSIARSALEASEELENLQIEVNPATEIKYYKVSDVLEILSRKNERIKVLEGALKANGFDNNGNPIKYGIE